VSLATLRVGHIPVMAARNEDMRGKWIMLFPHFIDRGIYFTHGTAERGQGILQAIGAHLFE
jgi:hypothetical protein